MENIYWQRLVDEENTPNRQNLLEKGLIDTYHLIFNCLTNVIEYVSDTYEFVTGLKKEELSVRSFLALIHPEDLDHCQRCEERVKQFTSELTYGEHFRYNVGYFFRMRIQDGRYIVIRQQRQTVDINAHGDLTKIFVTHKKMIYSDDLPNKDYYIFDRQKNEFLRTDNPLNLTKREWAIFDLICDGLSSTQIADKLHVSRHTIDTHRKNILKRTNTKNFFELQTKYQELKEIRS